MEIIIKNITVEELKDLFGRHKEVKPKVKCKPRELSRYARVFDETCLGWTRDSEMNKLFLMQQQNYANVKLEQRGYLFLNEVYDMLGMPRTKVGQIVGWLYDAHNPVGDNFVDFGLWNQDNRHFINGREKTVVLDFNVDGNILDYLEEEP